MIPSIASSSAVQEMPGLFCCGHLYCETGTAASLPQRACSNENCRADKNDQEGADHHSEGAASAFVCHDRDSLRETAKERVLRFVCSPSISACGISAAANE